jgi:hypothetical protein
MVVANVPLDLGTLLIVVVVIAGFWTLRTLLKYFLGGNKPLREHIDARIEVNRKPEDVQDAADEYDRNKLKRALLFVLAFVLVVWRFDQPLLDEIALTLWEAVQAIAEWAGQLLARFVGVLSR